MNSSSSGRSPEGFFTGKGFYIVLFLCAAVIGVSAWMMAAGNETMASDLVTDGSTAYSDKRVETIIIPPAESDAADAAVPAMQEDAQADAAAQESEDAVAAFSEAEAAEAAPVWQWPVSGSVERAHSAERLSYDVTMRDWRTHEGIDIAAPAGSAVTASRGGTVESVATDDLYGTVITIDHGDGTKAVYANLDAAPAVAVSEAVEAGYILGAVGSSALAEVGQTPHLHFAVMADGVCVDPLSYLA